MISSAITVSQPITLVIPIYNEKRGIGGTIQRARAVLPLLPVGSRCILVNDGSTDGTAKKLEASLQPSDAPAITVLHHRRNRGYGQALKTGIRAAETDLIAITDADGTYPTADIPKLLAEMEGANPAAMVVGARAVRDQPPERRLAKWFLTRLAEYLTGEKIPDLNSGLRIFHRADVLRLENLLPSGFSFTTTITMALLTEGREVRFIPISYKTRLGQSKIRPIKDTARFLLLITQTTLAFQPMKVFGPLGIGLLALGALFLVARLITGESFGIATTITLLVGGVQVLAIGLLADLVNRRGVR